MPSTPASPHPADTPPAAAPARGRLVIAGLGLLTPLGHAAWPTFTALLAGRTVSDRAARLAESGHAIDPVNLVRALGGVSIAQHSRADPAVELAERAAREAAFAGGVQTHQLPAYLGTSKGAVHALTRCGQRCLSLSGSDNRETASNADSTACDPDPLVLGPHGYLSHHLQQRLGVIPRQHIVAACASSLGALDHAARALRCGEAREGEPDHALVITAEAALLPQFVHSYRRLGVLAPLTPEQYRQRPLDGECRRQGFMLTEAGAAVVLKRLPVGAAPAPGEIELIETATAAEAHDIVRAAPGMPALRHVAERLLGAGSIDMIHPHAPGTPEHDPAELDIYREVLAGTPARTASMSEGRSLPDLYACKGALGHSLGASGLVSLVLACLCLQAGQRPPMGWLDVPLEGVRPKARRCGRTGTHAVFAAGFGGHVAGAVVQRH